MSTSNPIMFEGIFGSWKIYGALLSASAAQRSTLNSLPRDENAGSKKINKKHNDTFNNFLIIILEINEHKLLFGGPMDGRKFYLVNRFR
jgi:hypothetical protein